jgi:hypothetical protein
MQQEAHIGKIINITGRKEKLTPCGAFDLYQKSVKKILKDLQNPHHWLRAILLASHDRIF